MAPKKQLSIALVQNVRQKLEGDRRHGPTNSPIRGELKREWNSWSLLAFGVLTLCSWEGASNLVGLAFLNGGPAALLYGFILSGCGLLCVYASLAEMSSMQPAVGAQYTWTAQFCPQRIRAFASYVQGWLTVISWLASIPAITYLMAMQIQGLVIFTHPTTVWKTWYSTVIMIFLNIITSAANIFGKRQLPAFTVAMAIIHVVFFFGFIIPMLALGTRAQDSFVWNNSESFGMWPNKPISFCVGLLTPTFSLAGSEAPVHLAEETNHSDINVPRAVLGAVLINLVLAFGFMIVSLYCITDLDELFTSVAPGIIILHQATGSVNATIVLQCLTFIPELAACICILASASRLTWAFSRDNGIFNSKYLSHINPDYRAPVRAILFNSIIACIISLVVIASPTVFAAILSFASLTLYASYLFPIIFFLHYRVQHAKSITYGPWRLGVFGIPINIASICFCIFLIIFLPFPQQFPVTPANMNWAGPILGILLVITSTYYICVGRKTFKGPLVSVSLHDPNRGDDGAMFNVFGREAWLSEGSDSIALSPRIERPDTSQILPLRRRSAYDDRHDTKAYSLPSTPSADSPA